MPPQGEADLGEAGAVALHLGQGGPGEEEARADRDIVAVAVVDRAGEQIGRAVVVDVTDEGEASAEAPAEAIARDMEQRGLGGGAVVSLPREQDPDAPGLLSGACGLGVGTEDRLGVAVPVEIRPPTVGGARRGGLVRHAEARVGVVLQSGHDHMRVVVDRAARDRPIDEVGLPVLGIAAAAGEPGAGEEIVDAISVEVPGDHVDPEALAGEDIDGRQILERAGAVAVGPPGPVGRHRGVDARVAVVAVGVVRDVAVGAVRAGDPGAHLAVAVPVGVPVPAGGQGVVLPVDQAVAVVVQPVADLGRIRANVCVAIVAVPALEGEPWIEHLARLRAALGGESIVARPIAITVDKDGDASAVPPTADEPWDKQQTQPMHASTIGDMPDRAAQLMARRYGRQRSPRRRACCWCSASRRGALMRPLARHTSARAACSLARSAACRSRAACGPRLP